MYCTDPSCLFRTSSSFTLLFVQCPLLIVYFCRCLHFRFLSTLTSMHVAKNSCCATLVGYVVLSRYWAAKLVASAVDRIWCSLSVRAGCCDLAVQGFLARLSGSRTCTHVAPPERARLRTKGFCGASGEATARGVNLSEDMVADCRQNEAANHTGTVLNGQKSQTYCPYSMQTWVSRIAIFKGFPNPPHIPPPYGTLSGHKCGNKGSDPLKREKLADSPPMLRDMKLAVSCYRLGAAAEDIVWPRVFCTLVQFTLLPPPPLPLPALIPPPPLPLPPPRPLPPTVPLPLTLPLLCARLPSVLPLTGVAETLG